MRTISVLTIAGVALLVLLRMKGISTDVLALDVMVRLFMESIHLA